MSSPYNGPWVRVRLAVLARDAYQCQIKLPGCTHKATQVDHIIPLAHGGARLDPSNLRAACRRCNIAAGNKAIPRGTPNHHVAARTAAPSRAW